MAEGLGIAASVIAVVDLSAKIGSLYSQYIKAVKNAKDDVARLLQEVTNLNIMTADINKSLNGPDSTRLRSSHRLGTAVKDSLAKLRTLKQELEKAKDKLRPGGRRSKITKYLNFHALRTLLLSINERIDGLAIQAKEDVSTARQPHFVVPFPRDPDFVERPAIQSWIQEQYSSPASRMALVAIDFSHEVHSKWPDRSVFWVHGGTRASFEESYRSLADSLAIPHRHDPMTDVLALVHDWLQRQDIAPWLMVLDNANNLDTFFNTTEQSPMASYLPKTGNGKILVTSRKLIIAEKLTGSQKFILQISTIDNVKALKLFQHKLKSSFNKSRAEELIYILNFVPLTYMLMKGDYAKADILITKAFNARERFLGAEHPSTLTCMNNLASTFWNQGRWKEAESLDQGRWKEAESLEVKVMETTQRVLGEEHPSTLTSIANLASTFWNQGQWKEAESLEVKVMETRQRVLGEEHPSTLTSMANLASIYMNQGRWKEAESLEVKVMETRQRVLGEEHPSTLMSMNNLASTFWNQGQWKEAESLYVKVMEIIQRVLGEEHPSTLMSMANLASTYINQGRWKEAELLQVKVMEKT
ncbi:hypothetical protein S7711_09809 [Stachybotrys chartarum IBT 7711]|uniref:Fungal N-terminal domain-containing protein n=1 Tax=Stachybotrys chartarum (strain CBS 109288 / IBT 7711) TaxID=1280523 RepID=A0A084BBD6_STACB|nr:hypothetical protein S7711_09809 [Stachybotrys chartarum IBT 7711]